MNARRRRWLAWVLVVTAGLGAALGLSGWRHRGRRRAEPEAGNEPAVATTEAPMPVLPDAVRAEPEAPPAPERMLTSGPLISVIVTTEDISLPAAVTALEQQAYRDWELLAVVVDPGPPPVSDDGRVAVVLAPIGDRRTGERLALGRAAGSIVTRGVPADPAWLSRLAGQWLDQAGAVGPSGARAEDAHAELLGRPADAPPPAPGLPALSLARSGRAAGRQIRRPALANAGG